MPTCRIAYPTTDPFANANSYFGRNCQFNALAVPEPGTWAELAFGAVILGVVALRRRATVRV